MMLAHMTLSATPKGNGYQATIALPGGVLINSAENYPTITEAIRAAARKLLEIPGRLEALDHKEAQSDRA